MFFWSTKTVADKSWIGFCEQTTIFDQTTIQNSSLQVLKTNQTIISKHKTKVRTFC